MLREGRSAPRPRLVGVDRDRRSSPGAGRRARPGCRICARSLEAPMTATEGMPQPVRAPQTLQRPSAPMHARRRSRRRTACAPGSKTAPRVASASPASAVQVGLVVGLVVIVRSRSPPESARDRPRSAPDAVRAADLAAARRRPEDPDARRHRGTAGGGAGSNVFGCLCRARHGAQMSVESDERRTRDIVAGLLDVHSRYTAAPAASAVRRPLRRPRP